MCSNAEDLRSRAKWDGSKGTSRRTLLSNLQRMSREKKYTVYTSRILTGR